jgi:DNA-binding response OmpR family regulator
MRVLLVDDDPDIRFLCELALRDVAGWEVHVAAEGEEALELARREPVDLVLLDVMMPGLDGPTLLGRLREIPEAAELPILFVTAKVQAREVERYLAMGVDGLIAKPFDPLTLAERIEGILAMRSRR